MTKGICTARDYSLKLLALALLLTCSAWGYNCHAINPAAVGTNDGSSWTNAFTAIPASPIRSDFYYQAGGSYAKAGIQTFNTAESGTSKITFKPATVADHGSGSGCANDISAGWNNTFEASSSNQIIYQNTSAVANSFSFIWDIKTGYWDFEYGTTECGRAHTCRALINNAWPHEVQAAVQIEKVAAGNSASTIILRGVEYAGGGLDNGLSAGVAPFHNNVLISTISCASNVATIAIASARYHDYAFVGQWIQIQNVTNTGFNTTATGVQITQVTDSRHFQVGTTSLASYTCPNAANDTTGNIDGVQTQPEVFFRAVGVPPNPGPAVSGGSNLTLEYTYCHDTEDCITTEYVQGMTVRFNAFERAQSYATGPNMHANDWQDQASSNLVYAFNYSLDREGTATGGVTVLRVNASLNTTDSVQEYGNVTAWTYGNPLQRTGTGNGTFGTCINAETCTNWSVYNNTVVNATAGVLIGINGTDSKGTGIHTNNICENNLSYNNASASSANWSACTTTDYNSYLGLPVPTLGAHDVSDPTPPAAATIFSNVTNVTCVNQVCQGPTVTLASDNADWNNWNALAAPYNIDIAGTTRTTDRGAYQFVTVAVSYTVTASCSGNANGTIIGSAGSVMNAVCTAGVCSGTCSESITAGNSGTYTGAATTGSMTAFSIGACVTSPCTVTVNSPLTVTATFQATVTCTLTLAANSLNSPTTVSATTALAGLSGPNSFWFVLDPLNTTISLCNYPYSGCAAVGQSGNLPYTVSGLYSLGACSNGVCCTGSTAPLNINTGAGSAAH